MPNDMDEKISQMIETIFFVSNEGCFLLSAILYK